MPDETKFVYIYERDNSADLAGAAMLISLLIILTVAVIVAFIFISVVSVIFLIVSAVALINCSVFIIRNIKYTAGEVKNSNQVYQKGIPFPVRVKNYYFYRSYPDFILTFRCYWRNIIEHIKEQIDNCIDSFSDNFFVGVVFAFYGIVTTIWLLIVSNLICLLFLSGYLFYLAVMSVPAVLTALTCFVIRKKYENPYRSTYLVEDKVNRFFWWKVFDSTHFFWGLGFVFMAVVSFSFTDMFLEKLPYTDSLVRSIIQYVHDLDFSDWEKGLNSVTHIAFVFNLKDWFLSEYAVILLITCLALIVSAGEFLWNILTCRKRKFREAVRINSLLTFVMLWVGISGVEFASIYNFTDRSGYIDLPNVSTLFKRQEMYTVCRQEIMPFNCQGAGRGWMSDMLTSAGVGFADSITKPIPSLELYAAARNNDVQNTVKYLDDGVEKGVIAKNSGKKVGKSSGNQSRSRIGSGLSQKEKLKYISKRLISSGFLPREGRNDRQTILEASRKYIKSKLYIDSRNLTVDEAYSYMLAIEQ